MILYNLMTDWIWPGEAPTNYGWYHIMCFIIMIIICIFTSIFIAKKHNSKIDDRFVFAIGLTLVLAEIYKQVFYALEAGYYRWYAFPFQFCSVPMYFAFIAPLVKNKKIQDGMYKFLASFGLLAGIAVMIYPGDCLNTPYITILIHTMLWHSFMVVMGVYLIVAKGYGKKLRELLTALPAFFAVIIIALTANVIAYHTYFKIPELNVHEQQFYLFYISPYYPNPFPVLSIVKENYHFVLFLLLYMSALIVGVAILWSVIMLIRKLIKNNKELNIT